MNEEINQLEQYIFAKNRKLFLDNLIKDTESYYYFSLLEAIDNQGNALTSEQEEDLKRYRKFRTASSKGIRVRYLFRQYDKAESDEAKKKVIQELNSKLFKVTGVLPNTLSQKENGLVGQQQQAFINRRISRSRSQSSINSSQCEEEEFDEDEQEQEIAFDEQDDGDNSQDEERLIQIEEGSSVIEEVQQVVSAQRQVPQDSEQQINVEEEDEEEEEQDQSNKKDYPSQFNNKKLEVDLIIKKNSLEKLLAILNLDSLIRIPVKKIKECKEYYTIQLYLQKVDVYALSCEELIEILLHYQSLVNKNKNYDQEIVQNYEKYTLEQLISIGTNLPDVTKDKEYVKNVFLKQFDLQKIKTLEGQARIDELWIIYEWSKGLKQKFQSLQDQILFEILYQGIQFDIYDHKVFIEYLNNPKEQISELNEQSQKKYKLLKKSYDSFWHNVHSFESVEYSQAKLIKKYIKKHLKSSKTYSVSPYDEYFQTNYLQKILIQVRLYEGDQNVPKVSKYLSPSEISTIYSTKEVKILKSNKKSFVQNEKVTLNVQLKNIDKLYVKIFNFVPENYYLKNLADFNEHVDLDGLSPNEEVFFDFKPENIHPCTRFVKAFDFESIQKTSKGIFIIEFFSSGIASRAIIYKGSLTFFSRNTIAGQEIVILDEEGNIQSEGRVGLWIDKEFYQAKKDGRILVPYRKDSQKQIQCILVSDKFAQLTSLTHLNENYKFSCNYIYNQESFIFGNKVQLILQPSLTINQEIADVSILKGTEISIVTITTDDVPQTTRISKKTLQNDQDIVIEFILPAKTKQVNIELNTKLDTMNGTEELKLNSTNTIYIDQHTNQLNFASFFLQNVDQYYILVLGKNGEPIPNFKVSINLQHKYFNTDNNIKLQTNEEGRIGLGKLNNVISLQVASELTKNNLTISKKWNLERNYIRGIESLPHIFQIKEGNNVEIPLLCEQNTVIDRNEFILLKIVDKNQNLQQLIANCLLNCISNETNKVEKTTKNTLLIKNLSSGLYFLRSKLNTKNFIIKVHNCKIWQHSSQTESATSSILTKNKLLLNQSSVPVEDQIRVESFKNESGKIQIQLNRQKSYQNTRVHLIAFQYFPNGLSNPYNNFCTGYDNYKIQEVNLQNTKNKYMSNRQLGDEFAYVLDRKVQTRFTGNSLEKPSLAIKRNFIQDTNTETENIQADKPLEKGFKRKLSVSDREEKEFYERDASYCNFDEAEDEECFDDDASYQECKREAPIKYKKSMAKKARGMASPSDRIYFNRYDYNCQISPIDAHLNFLKNTCLIYSNLVPNKDGLIEFEENLSKYSAVQIILRTPTHHNVSVFNLEHLLNREIETRDLRQKTNLQKGKYYSIFRNTETIMKGKQCIIDDITSTEFSIIDSLNKVFDFQIELSRFAGTFTDSTSSKSFTEEWEFLKKWDSLSTSEKNQKYNNNLSHELNFFLYLKDKPYFDSIVKNHLQNKIEFTLVDLFLLGKYEDLINKYHHIEILDRINSFEICLMIYSLKQLNQLEKAQKLIEYLQVQSKQNVSDKEIQKRYFEIILNKKQDQQAQSGKKMVIQQAAYNISNIGGGGSYQNRNKKLFGDEDDDDDDDNCSNSLVSEENEQYQCGEAGSDEDFECYQQNNDCEEEMFEQQRQFMPKMASKAKQNYKFNPITSSYKQQRQLFQQCNQALKKTGQYCERHYLNQKDDHFYGKELMSANSFWLEFAHNILETSSISNFLSCKFLECNKSHTEMVLVLSILNLPFNSPNHNQYSAQGKDQVIQAADNFLLFTKEIKETSSQLKSTIMINQRFFDPNDKYEIQGEEKFEKDAQEFIINYIYGCQVIVTNCTGGQQEIQVLTEVPEGSVPVHTIEYTKSYTQKLDSYSTKIFEFYFYFPAIGNYSIYPANVSKNGQVLCVAKDSQFQVNKELAQIKLNTLDQVLSQGTKEDILKFLKEKDWQDTNKQSNFNSTFMSIVSMCTDKEFFIKLLQILRQKNFFHFDIWKYSLLHLDHASLIEFVNSSSVRQKVQKYVSHLSCTLIKSSLNIGEWNRIYEYYPLINSRVHLLKRDSANILNSQFRRTYCHFLRYVVEKGLNNMSSIDRLVFTYYLLLQDRIEIAIEQFDKINESDITTKQGSIQYDYIKAYLDFYKGYPNFKVAREIIEKYLDYPIISWRNLFYDMANQIAEYDGEDMIGEELLNLNISGDSQLKKEDKVQNEKQQVLSLRFDDKKIIVEHKNIPKELTLTYYKIDLEVFFSKKPFLSNISEDFSYLQPSFTQIIALNDEDKNQSTPTVSKFDVPEQIQGSNVYIQAISGPFLKAGVTYFSTQLKVSLYSDDAYLKITDQSNSLLSKIYVKVFSKNKSGKIDFIKDGYTDLRGRFEYLLSSSVNINDIDKLSLFIMSDDHGSLILEAKPPKRIGQYTETVQLKSRNWAQKYETKLKNKK
ncbi:hypothetical protein TTHERM_00444610 (macronuclear) [Tetrahymena thermophila SB210]|uniref:Uncharacterized protein n=1 Tax=Tetrahymena thermophila (strain SB210) TaxID=312017 RepID=I7M9Z0_TETTS|nr:hypothetical protein TTHERM_00444610 [Tetrahymena thermophila SB210]EAS03079.2 hypothetical protein TTHERM_00444610 [Tetrahymena thermophila SB210]|eukprot:XP_001023324.2 hypothetical protein TTHERM_00444610 [Tetrahymena thermophila SB210]